MSAPGSGSFFPYARVSDFFEAEGDFEENLEDPRSLMEVLGDETDAIVDPLDEHAFVPGDGEMTYMDVCQHVGCGRNISEHEEGEPCCFPFMSTRGQQHAYDCPEDVKPATFGHSTVGLNHADDDKAADAYERHLGL